MISDSLEDGSLVSDECKEGLYCFPIFKSYWHKISDMLTKITFSLFNQVKFSKSIFFTEYSNSSIWSIQKSLIYSSLSHISVSGPEH